MRILILLVNPLQCFYFVIFVICLQQLDGNVIGPKILGNTIGISGFWVLVSITVAAGLFGFAGMLLGVPVFAIIYLLISDAINLSLKRRATRPEQTHITASKRSPTCKRLPKVPAHRSRTRSRLPQTVTTMPLTCR